jgi:hypothetical protein
MKFASHITSKEAKALSILGYSEDIIHVAFGRCGPSPSCSQLLDAIHKIEDESQALTA